MNKIILFIFICVFYLLNFITPCQAANPVLLHDNDHLSFSLGSHTEYLIDNNQQLPIEKILSSPYTQQFTPSRSDQLLFGFTAANVWLRFTITNTQNRPAYAFLILNQTNLKTAELYEINKNGQPEKIPTVNQPAFLKNKIPQIKLISHSFSLNFLTKQSKTFYLKMHSDHYIAQSITLASLDTLVQHLNLIYFLLGACLGVFVTLGFYHLCFYFSTWMRIYLYYALVAFTCFGFFAVHYGLLKSFSLSSFLRQDLLEVMLAWALIFTNALFTRDFFSLMKHYPTWKKLSNILLCLFAACLITTPLLGARISGEIALSTLLIATVSLWPVLAWISYREKLPGTYYFITLKILQLITAILMVLAFLGWQDITALVTPGYLAVALLEMVFMSFALYRRTKYIRQYKNKEKRINLISETEIRAKTEFAHQMNQEIKIPVNGILGMIDLLNESTLSVQQRDYIRVIQSSSRDLLKTIDDILDFSKIESGHIDLKYNGFDLTELITHNVESFRHQANEKQLQLISHIADDVPRYVIGDEGRIRQVLNNLLGHAIRSTERGEVVLSVDIADPEKNIIRFIITDTGAGIPRNYTERLLEDFSENSLRLHARYGVTGLSLALAKHLIRLMGGDVQAQKRSGQGGRFWFTLPLSPQAFIEDHFSTVGLRGLKILIVDDNASYRTVLEQQAISWGLQVTTAMSHHQALAALRTQAHLNEPFNILLTNQEMPGFSGLQLAYKVKQENLMSSTKAIFIFTEDSRALSLQEAESTGLIQAVLEKPISGKKLKVSLLQALNLIQPSRQQPISHHFSTHQALLVDSHKLTTTVINNMLEVLKVDCSILLNSDAVLEEYSTHIYDILFMSLDVADSLTIVKNIRAQEKISKKSSIPIIGFATKNMKAAQIESALAAGFNDYLLKPVKIEKLKEILEKYLK